MSHVLNDCSASSSRCCSSVLLEPSGFQETPSVLTWRGTPVSLDSPLKLLQQQFLQLLPQLLQLRQQRQPQKQPPLQLQVRPLPVQQQQQRKSHQTQAHQSAPGLANDPPLDTMSGLILTTMAGAGHMLAPSVALFIRSSDRSSLHYDVPVLVHKGRPLFDIFTQPRPQCQLL